MAFVGQTVLHFPQRMHSALLQFFVTSTTMGQNTLTGPAADAFVFVHMHLEKAEVIEQGIERPKQAQIAGQNGRG